MQAMAEGQTIKHEVYGLGVVTASDGERTSVDFDDHGTKLFVTSIMTAELIGEAPATPPKTKRRSGLRQLLVDIGLVDDDVLDEHLRRDLLALEIGREHVDP